jgi:hypothetical protein
VYFLQDFSSQLQSFIPVIFSISFTIFHRHLVFHHVLISLSCPFSLLVLIQFGPTLVQKISLLSLFSSLCPRQLLRAGHLAVSGHQLAVSPAQRGEHGSVGARDADGRVQPEVEVGGAHGLGVAEGGHRGREGRGGAAHRGGGLGAVQRVTGRGGGVGGRGAHVVTHAVAAATLVCKNDGIN